MTAYFNNSGDTTQNHTVTWNTSNGTFPDGVYNISVRATNSTNASQVTDYINLIVNLTVDNTQPVTSGYDVVELTRTTARIIWDTDESSNSSIGYGNSSTALNSLGSNTSLYTNHSISLTGLNWSQIYYYNFTSCDDLGNCNVTGTHSFTTYAYTPNITLNNIIYNVTNASAPFIGGVSANNSYIGHWVDTVINVSTVSSANLTVNITNSTNGITISQLDTSDTGTSHLVNWTYNATYSDGAYDIILWAINDTNATQISMPVTVSSVTIDKTNASISAMGTREIEATSTVIIWTTNEASNSTIKYGSSISILNQNATNASFGTGHSVKLSGLATQNTYYANITSCDYVGNCNTTGPINFTTSAVTDPGDGGEGEGEGEAEEDEGPEAEDAFSEQKSLNVGNSFSFREGGSAHSAELTSIDYENLEVTITISSDPFEITIAEGDSVSVDVDGDETLDLRITVLDIMSASKAKLLFEGIASPIETGVEGEAESEGEAEAEGEGEVEESIPQFNYVWWIVGIVALAVILYFVVRAKKK